METTECVWQNQCEVKSANMVSATMDPATMDPATMDPTKSSSNARLSVSTKGFELLRRILIANVYPSVKQTDLTKMSILSQQLDQQIYLKREDQQPVQSFKIRGAYNKLARQAVSQNGLQQDENAPQPREVVAASAGNHAQGLAFAARQLNIKATIFMPITTPDIKVENVKRLGGNVILIGKNFDQAQAESVRYANANNFQLIHPFDDLDVIAGQGTLGKELLQQLPDANVVFVPVGGGGLLAGVGAYIKLIDPTIQVVAVEAEDSACLQAALTAGEPVELEQVGLFADGVAVKRIGEQTFELIKQYCDALVTVSSDEICAAIKDIYDETRVIAEPAGALSLAGLKKMALSQQLASKQKLIAILSGANMSFHNLRYVSERCELGEQKEAVLSVAIAEKKGSFLQFCKSLDGRVITEFNYRYASAESANIFVGVRLSDHKNEKEKLISNLRSQHYQVADLTNNELAKLHVRYMVGGNSVDLKNERIFRFQFPEYPGALEMFLSTLGELWNISLFHYRNHGAAYGQVLAGFEVDDSEQLAFFRHLKELDYEWCEETHNPAYQSFLAG